MRVLSMVAPFSKFPKIHCPLIRAGRPYRITPEDDPEMKWWRRPDVLVREKIDGQNVAWWEFRGEILAIDIRNHRIYGPGATLKETKTEERFRRAWAARPRPLAYVDDPHFHRAELIGPKIQGNRYGLARHQLVEFKGAPEYGLCVDYRLEGFGFKELCRWLTDLDSLAFPGHPAEGVILEYGQHRAKLRADMVPEDCR